MSFREYLNEVAWSRKQIDLIKSMNSYIPLADDVISSVFKFKPVKRYHLSNVDDFGKLLKLQKKKNSISTFRRITQGAILDGIIYGNTGIITQLRGNPLMSKDDDIMTEVDENGERWYSVQNEKIDSLIKEMKIRLNTGQKLNNNDHIILYKEGIKKLMRENKSLFKSELISSSGGWGEWDETLLNKISVENVFMIKDVISPKDEVKFKEKYKGKYNIQELTSDEFVKNFIRK